jgi:hypothetical protein
MEIPFLRGEAHLRIYQELTPSGSWLAGVAPL